MRPIVSAISATVAFIGFITIMFGSWYTIDQGERGVIMRNGAVIGTAEPGWHGKVPFIDSVVALSVHQQTLVWSCDKGQPCMQAYSQDQQPADLRVSVNYHVPDSEVAHVYSVFGTVAALADRVIAPKANQAIKTVFGRYTAVSVVQDRGAFNLDVLKAVTSAIDGPVIIDSVQVENIDFSDAYEKSVEARMTAQVDVQRREQELAQKKIEAQITVTEAQAEADSNLAKAKALAEATRIQGEATAAAIRARAEALGSNPLS